MKNVLLCILILSLTSDAWSMPLGGMVSGSWVAAVNCTLTPDEPTCLLGDLFSEVSKRASNIADFVENSAKKEKVDITKYVSPEHIHCAIKAEGDCDVLGNISYARFATSGLNIALFNQQQIIQGVQISLARSDEEAQFCSCVEARMYLQIGAVHKNPDKVIDQIVGELKKDVLRAYGKKTLNEYSLIYEDGMYFLNQTDTISKDNKDKALCRGAEGFRSAIQKSCPNKSKSDIDKRISLIFSGLDLDGGSSLEKKLEAIDLQTVHRKVKDKDGNEIVYLRDEYDNMRYGLRMSHEYQVLDKMLTNLFSSKDVRFDREEYRYKPSYIALSGELSKLLLKDFDGTVAKIFNNEVPKEYVDQWREISKKPNAEKEFEKKFSNHFTKVASSHPGLSALLLNSKMFDNFRTHASKKKINSVFEELEDGFHKIEDYMTSRCSSMIEDFALVACAEEDEILKGLGKESLSEFIKDKPAYSEGGFKELLACRGGQNNLPSFLALAPDGSQIVNSDLFISLDSKTETNDPFTYAATNVVNNKTKRDVINLAASAAKQVPRESSYNPITQHQSLQKERIISSSGTVSEGKSFWSRFGRDKSDNDKVERSIASVTSSETAGSRSESTFSTNVATNTVMSTFNPAFNRMMNADREESKESYYETFSSLENNEEASSHISKLENGELDELKKFKEQVLAEKEESLKSKIEEEKRNLELLKKQISDITTGKSVIEEKTMARDSIDKDNKEVASSTIRSSLPDFKEALYNRVASVDRGGYSGSSFSTSGGAASVSSSGSSVTSAAARSKTPEATGSSYQDSSNAKDSAQRSGLVVQGTSPVVNGKQDITNNIVEFLKTADSETFLKFTTEGVVYKYKIVENGVEVEKEVFVSVNDVDPQALAEIVKESEAKLSRMQRKYSYQALKVIISEEALKL